MLVADFEPLTFNLTCSCTYHTALPTELLCPEGKFLVTKFEFGGRFGMSSEGDFYEVEVTPNLELLVNIGMSFEGVCHELYT